MTTVAMRRGIVSGCMLGFASGWNLANVGAVAADLAQAYGVALATIGLLTTAMFITHTAVQLPGGRIIDRIGPARAGLIALAVLSAGSLLALTAASPAVAIAGRAVSGLGTGLAFISGSALVRESGGSPFAQGMFGGLATTAGGLALAIVPPLEGAFGWRAPYWSSLALALAALVAVMAAGRGIRRAVQARPDVVVSVLLRDRRLHQIAVVFSASYALNLILGNWVVELLERSAGLAATQAGLIGSTTLLLGIVARPLGGWVLRTHPVHARAVIGASLVAGTAGTLLLVAAGPTWSLAVGGVLVGLAAGIPFAASFTGAAAANPQAPAASVAVVNSIGNGVILVGTPLVGLTFSLPGAGRIGFVVIAALWLGALALLPSSRLLGVEAPG